MNDRLWSLVKIGISALVGLITGYFIPNNSVEQAVECFIRAETGIAVDFHPDTCPVPPTKK